MTLKIDFESYIWALFDDLFESQWKSNQKSIFLELIVVENLLQVNTFLHISTNEVMLAKYFPKINIFEFG